MEAEVLSDIEIPSRLATLRDLCEGLAATRTFFEGFDLVAERALADGASWVACWQAEPQAPSSLTLQAQNVAAGAAPPEPGRFPAGTLEFPLDTPDDCPGMLAIGPMVTGQERPPDDVVAWQAVALAFKLAWRCWRRETELQATRRTLGRRELDLGTLFGISQELNSSLSTRTIAQTLLFSAMGHCAVRAGTVVALEGERHETLAQQGLADDPRATAALDRALAGQSFDPDDPAIAPWGLFLPIRHQGSAIGLLALERKLTGRPFSREEVSFLQAMTEQAAIAMANAAYCEDLQATLERERRIHREKEKMRRYISSAAMAHVEGDDDTSEGRTIWATILFADVRGFTSLSEKNRPQDVVRLLNLYMSRMADIILEHDGVVDKFMGDGIMAYFQPADASEDSSRNDAMRAVQCAIAMRREVLRMNSEEAFGKGQELRIGIGLNSGEAVAGNIGSADRMDFTLIGDNVNLTARLEGAAKPWQILLSTSTVERLGGQIPTRYFDTLVLKGKAVPLDVHEVPSAP